MRKGTQPCLYRAYAPREKQAQTYPAEREMKTRKPESPRPGRQSPWVRDGETEGSVSRPLLAPPWTLMLSGMVTQSLPRSRIHPLPTHTQTQNTCLHFFVIPLFSVFLLSRSPPLPPPSFILQPRLPESCGCTHEACAPAPFCSRPSRLLLLKTCCFYAADSWVLNLRLLCFFFLPGKHGLCTLFLLASRSFLRSVL